MYIKFLLENIPKTQSWTRYLASAPRPKNISHSSSVDPKDVQRFEELSKKWWNPNGPMIGLHALNKIRFVIYFK